MIIIILTVIIRKRKTTCFLLLLNLSTYLMRELTIIVNHLALNFINCGTPCLPLYFFFLLTWNLLRDKFSWFHISICHFMGNSSLVGLFISIKNSIAFGQWLYQIIFLKFSESEYFSNIMYTSFLHHYTLHLSYVKSLLSLRIRKYDNLCLFPVLYIDIFLRDNIWRSITKNYNCNRHQWTITPIFGWIFGTNSKE